VHFFLGGQSSSALGQFNLGNAYENGLGVERNNVEAIRYYRLAAAQDNQEAKDALKRLNVEK
jgi:TPR repeat protein